MKTTPYDVRGLVNCFLGFGLFLLAAFGRFPEGSPMVLVTTAFGLGLMIYSLVSDFTRVPRGRSARRYLLIDLAIGGTLAASPWLFDFARVSALPQVVVGLFVIGNALFTLDLARRRDVRLGAAFEPDGHPATWSNLNRMTR